MQGGEGGLNATKLNKLPMQELELKMQGGGRMHKGGVIAGFYVITCTCKYKIVLHNNIM